MVGEEPVVSICIYCLYLAANKDKATATQNNCHVGKLKSKIHLKIDRDKGAPITNYKQRQS